MKSLMHLILKSVTILMNQLFCIERPSESFPQITEPLRQNSQNIPTIKLVLGDSDF
jgi:hypothetical protein